MFIASRLKQRTVPRSTARSGMTLYASPPWIWVTLTTTVSTGRALRDTIDCSAVVMWLATSTGSMPASGRAPCAPLPVIAMSKNAPPAIIAPSRIWNFPTASPGRLCMPKTTSQGNSSNSPSRIIASAPPRPSSAG